MLETNRPCRRAARVVGRLAGICVLTFSMTGCGFVKGIAMIPIKVAEAVAVETAKVPFKAAGLAVNLTLDAAGDGVDAILSKK